MSDGAEADEDGEDDAAEEGGVAESAAGTANRLRTRSRNYVDGDEVKEMKEGNKINRSKKARNKN